MAEGTRFDESMTVRLPASIPPAVRRAAIGRGQKVAEYVRAALVSALKADGVELEKPTSRTAGELYDVVEGRRRYAKIEGGALVSIEHISYHDQKPEDGDWRPVYHEDSEPFDLATKWRVGPQIRVEDERVVLTYQVVNKSLEWM